ncbi:hypothetical protein [Pectinatus sottacetonis]|uniref:hypothetical protein n=1 Tax=Pectinatus sottacetonis TaxID=1002795 RepID=UPI0018C83E1E|nr:hypothetical protein [Pectinatus sottacetonis]
MKKIISAVCFSMIVISFSVVQAAAVPEWAYKAADKLIKSGLLADKTITRDKLAEFLASDDNKNNNLSEKEKIAKIAQILATEKNVALVNKEKITIAPVENNKYLTEKNGEKIRKLPAGPSVPPLVKRFEEQAPQWIYESLERINKAGFISPDDQKILAGHNLTRREAAILTARAYNLHKQNNVIMTIPQNIYSSASSDKGNDVQIQNDIKSLMVEFNVELKALGYGAGYTAFTTKPTDKVDRSLSVHGEIRYDIMTNSSNNSKYNWNDKRIRARVYVTKPINDNWLLHGMIESDKSLSGDNNYYTKDKDGKITFDRYYISGKTNIFALPVDVEFGKTNAYLAEGNILDSDFKGVKIATFGSDTTDKSVLYSMGYGKVNNTQNMLYLETTYKTNKDADYTAGVYHWDDYGELTNIYSIGIDRYIGNYTLGAMYLRSDKSDSSGNANGYVLSSRYGYNRSWIPGTYEIDAHYYNMARTTYINHTMSGLGNYMNGFKGYSAGWYYTVLPDILLGVEYYNLEDKMNGDKVKTLWGQLTYGF